VTSSPPTTTPEPDATAPNGTGPDGDKPRDTTIVLGGAAAAEGRTTGPTPRIAGPASPGHRPPQTGEHAAIDPGDDESGGRHFRASATGALSGHPLWVYGLAALPVALLVLLIGAWAIDTVALSGQVQRNVEVAGRSVGGLGEESLPDVMASIADEVAARPVTITSGDKTYETTAGDIGLALDEEATAEAALDAGRGSLLTRPFSWLRSYFSPREVPVRFTVSEPTVTAKLIELQGADLTAPHDPTISLTDQGWVAVKGTPGRGLDAPAVVDELPDAAAESLSGPIELEVGTADVAPNFTDEEAQELADQANQMTGAGLSLTAADTTHQVPAAQLRTWIGPTTQGGELGLAIKPDVVAAALPQVFADIASEPRDAGVELSGGGVSITPSQQGVTCCGADSAERVWNALSGGQPAAELAVNITEPSLTTEQAQQLGIKQPVCGNHAWRGGAPTTAGPGFTTYYDPGQPRVTNIHRIADLVDGALVRPGETFSVNGHVGERTRAKGFVEAGAIREGEHVDEVGGGVSQFATTTFNAAYFCGLDITTYQAHSEYFPRYPLGREATMGYPAPDLAFVNDTPYGILIDTSYTSTSVTVTMWSTPYASAEQTGISESMSGNCRVVVTTRTITYPDKPPASDTFRATYRPGPSLPC
jgi:vancomycin resistance protein YoaR